VLVSLAIFCQINPKFTTMKEILITAIIVFGIVAIVGLVQGNPMILGFAIGGTTLLLVAGDFTDLG
jgi:FtsH-binding integral membrane protein